MSNIIKQWNKVASKYAENQEKSELVESNKQVVMNRFSQFHGEKILDIGCGYGFYTDYFRRIGGEVYGVDGSEVMIQLAKQKYPECHFSIADITKPLDYLSESFDIIFCNQVLMDLENVEAIFSECRRLL